jgi:hypothetical protein
VLFLLLDHAKDMADRLVAIEEAELEVVRVLLKQCHLPKCFGKATNYSHAVPHILHPVHKVPNAHVAAYIESRLTHQLIT